MSLPSRLVETIPAGDRLVLDTSAVIAYLKGDEAVSAAATFVLDEMVATGRNPATLSAITVAELLVRPVQVGTRETATVTAFLLGFPSIAIRSADFLVAAEAAAIRARTGASTADALIAATASLTSSPWLITNDRTLRDRLADLDWPTCVVMLDSDLIRDAGSSLTRQ